jgi:hypothetical protein
VACFNILRGLQKHETTYLKIVGMLDNFGRAKLESTCLVYVCMQIFTCVSKVSKAVPLHAMEALGGRGGIAPTHSLPRH